MEDGKKLFEFLKNYKDVELLSSPSRSEHSRLGKRLWVRNHKLGIKLNLEYSKNKQKQEKNNIPSTFEPDNGFLQNNTKTKMTAMARSIGLKGGCTRKIK